MQVIVGSEYSYIVVVTEKTSYVSNYAFIILLHEWIDRGQMHQLEKLLCV